MAMLRPGRKANAPPPRASRSTTRSTAVQESTLGDLCDPGVWNDHDTNRDRLIDHRTRRDSPLGCPAKRSEPNENEADQEEEEQNGSDSGARPGILKIHNQW